MVLMEELITYLSQYMPETVATILVMACSVMIGIIYKKVKINGTTLQTIAKERFDSADAICKSVSDRQLTVEKNVESAEKKIVKINENEIKLRQLVLDLLLIIDDTVQYVENKEACDENS